MPNRIQLRRGNAIDWFNANPLLAEGEICVELDTGKFKIGDGIHNWNDLLYASGPAGSNGSPGPAGPAGSTGTQINKLIDIPDINSTGIGPGSMLVYDGTNTWNTEKDLPLTSHIDAGEF